MREALARQFGAVVGWGVAPIATLGLCGGILIAIALRFDQVNHFGSFLQLFLHSHNGNSCSFSMRYSVAIVHDRINGIFEQSV